jgi:hypothetical protein
MWKCNTKYYLVHMKGMKMSDLTRSQKRAARRGIVVVVIIIIGCALLALLSQFAYFFNQVEETQLGVQLTAGRIKDVVPPGVYSDIGYMVDLKTVNIDAVPFAHTDESILTKDKQKVGFTVSGDVFRPKEQEVLRDLWPQYKNLFLDDEMLKSRMRDFTGQAMKVCVGNRNFDDAIIGTARDETKQCIIDELNKLTNPLGFRIANIAIPDVTMSPEAEAALDAIVASRLEAERWNQDTLKEKARTEAELAKEQGKIRVQQGKLEQEARSAADVAVAEEEKILAQKAVIEAKAKNELARQQAEFEVISARKDNEFEIAKRDKAIAEANLEVAALKAAAGVQSKKSIAEVITNNPAYGAFLVSELESKALQGVEKIFLVPEGSNISILSNQGAIPTVDVK